MSNQSNNMGRAYELACLITLGKEIRKIRSVKIVRNSSLDAAIKAWDNIDSSLKKNLIISAKAAAITIFELEPRILEDSPDSLILKLQADTSGMEGDVRDILIIREGIHWEIGLSIKHNHLAVKHSRLSKWIDFGANWFGKKCSDQYWQDVKPVFDHLTMLRKTKHKWNEIPDKSTSVYAPLLQAFINEINRSYKLHGSLIPENMVNYLLGYFDFYKVVCLDGRHLNMIQTFNLRGSLNQDSIKTKSKIKVPIAKLPTKIVSLDFRDGHKNKVDMILNEGWQFSFRIHNASTLVEPSLKFDIQIVGMPTTIITIESRWN